MTIQRNCNFRAYISCLEYDYSPLIGQTLAKFHLLWHSTIQWNLQIKDTLGAQLLSSFQRLSFGGRFEPICNLQSPQDLIYLDSIFYSLEVDFYTDVLLKLKHPEAKSVDLSTIVSSDSLPCDPHPVIYEQITGPLVRSIALITEGAAGPSGIDAQGW